MSAEMLAWLTHTVFVRHSLGVGAQFQAFRPRSGDVLVFHVTPQCSMLFHSFHGIPRRSTLFRDIPRYPMLFIDVQICSTIFHAVPCYSMLFHYIPRYSMLFLDVQICSTIFRAVPHYSQVSHVSEKVGVADSYSFR